MSDTNATMPPPPPPRYLVGLDLGQAADYSALAVARVSYRDFEAPAELTVGHLERFPIGTPYPAVVERVAALVTRPESRPDGFGPPELLIDATGVGRPVVDLFHRARLGIRVRPVTITGGMEARHEGPASWVPKKDLVAAVQAQLQGGRMQVIPTLEHAPILRAELMNFRVTITPNAHESFGAWREADHDDLVLAVAMTSWAAEQFRPVNVRIFT